MIDTLVSALTRLGPSAQAALVPALTATAALRALITVSPPPQHDAEPQGPRRRQRPSGGRHSQPEYWMSRDTRVAEALWLNAQPGRRGELADMFAALPPQAMIEAVNRRGTSEDWGPLLEELTRRYDA
ncbi:hypothetical protein ACFV8T_37810 [Streptomyces sp. NPDC059832]|uniref:hypothetical protein n=1 Tax=Streptomyces sp. NPDC059832 TaxID=3346966 RepID=UPI003658B7DF